MSNATLNDDLQPVKPEPSPRKKAIIWAVKWALLVLATLAGLFAIFVLPGALEAVQRGRQKRTMGDMRKLATAIEAYALDARTYPSIPLGTGTMSLDKLAPMLEPYMRDFPRRDGWGSSFQVTSIAAGYTITSFGSDRRRDGPDMPPAAPNGATTDFRSDIVYSMGWFVQFPDDPHD